MTDRIIFPAHIRDGIQQSVECHCENVARLASTSANIVGLSATAELTGLLHDAGKYSPLFREYICSPNGKKGSVYHSPVGAIFAYERWFNGADEISKLTVQMISMVIRAHHGGLLDSISPDGDSPYLESLRQDKQKLRYDDTMKNYFEYCRSIQQLDELFSRASNEISKKLFSMPRAKRDFTAGLLTKYLLSCIVDADRWDAACFEAGQNPLEIPAAPDWLRLGESLEAYLNIFSRHSDIGRLRGQISDYCLRASHLPPGIYSLAAPTGSGKTFSSLRFAINHAQECDMTRIFYVIPYNTILEQNAEDVRQALNGYDGLLEHFGTFISEKEGSEAEQEEQQHVLLSERWNSGIIFTSMVQFLNTVYRGENTNTRRFQALAKSIIIFDEIQALPKQCTKLFERLVTFLSQQLGCTVLLCTATLPGIEVNAQPLLPEKFAATLQSSFKRTVLEDKTDTPLNYDSAAEKLVGVCRERRAALLVVNTKEASRSVFERADAIIEPECVSVHLSTAMCPAHRLDKLMQMKQALKNGQQVLCVSTMLIEAGVNISFPFVARSMAGLPSIMQAAGRCNRHMELCNKLGNVQIWNLPQERLCNLPDISMGQTCTRCTRQAVGADQLDSTLAMDWYFKKEREENKPILAYPWEKQKELNTSLTVMLGVNDKLMQGVSPQKKADFENSLVLRQAFSSAGNEFKVIAQDTVLVVAPYGEGKELILDLSASADMRIRIRQLRTAQKYSVSVFRDTFNRLANDGAIYPLGDTGLYALRKEYYDDEKLGLVMDSGMADCLFS